MDGLRQDFPSPAPDQVGLVLGAGEARQHEHRKVGIRLPDPIQHRKAAEPRHPEVQNEQIHGVLLQAFERLESVDGEMDFMAVEGEGRLHDPPDPRIIFRHQDLAHVRHPHSPRAAIPLAEGAFLHAANGGGVAIRSGPKGGDGGLLAWGGWRRTLKEEAAREERQVLLGVDAGSRHLRLVQLQRGGNRLDRAMSRPLPREEREHSSVLRSSLREMLGETDDERIVTVNMQGERVFTRHLQLPPLAPHELAVAVPIEVENSLPFPLADAMHGFVVGESLDRDPTRRGITFVAAPRAVFSPLLNLLRDLTGMQNVTMEIPSFALARLPGTGAGPDFTALVEVGARFTHIGFARGGTVYYARDFAIGGEDFTHCLRVARGFTHDYAELLKTEEPVLRDPRRRAWMEPALTRWFQEVKRSLQYFRFRLPVAPLRVDRVLLSGGGAALQGLPDWLAEHLGLPVSILRPPVSEGDPAACTEMEARGPAMNVALGLALRAMQAPVRTP